MAESTLAMDLTLLRKEVTQLITGSRDYGSVSAETKEMVTQCIDSGYRNFLFPVLEGGKTHNWSFLTPRASLELNAPYSTGTVAITSGVVTLTSGTFPSWAASGVVTVSGISYTVNTRDSSTQVTLDDTSVTVASGASYVLDQRDYDLPDDFGGLQQDLVFDDRNYILKSTNLISEQRMMLLRAQFQMSPSIPYHAAIRYKSSGGTTGQRSEILFYPPPDDDYTLSYRYSRLPNKLTDAAPYPYGDASHAELVKLSCLSCAEVYVDEGIDKYTKLFRERLEVAVKADIHHVRENLGFLDDRNQSVFNNIMSGNQFMPDVTFTGVPS